MSKKPTRKKWPVNDTAFARDYFDLNETELQWVTAIGDADCEDPAALIVLLEQDRVPKRVMPYMARLLWAWQGRKPGRHNLLPTPTAAFYFLAAEQVRELAEEKGVPVSVAVKQVAPAWASKGITADALTKYCSGHTGYSRKHR